MVISVDEFKALTNCDDSLANKYYAATIKALGFYGIEDPIEIAGLLAQVSVETGCLRFMRELWGNTLQQQKYDPPNKLAVSLGNSEVGDGFKYRGGGMLQLTGKYNYHLCGLGIGVNLITNPEAITEPYIAASSACWYWQHLRLGKVLKNSGINAVTKIINGGKSQEIERKHVFEDNIKILCVG